MGLCDLGQITQLSHSLSVLMSDGDNDNNNNSTSLMRLSVKCNFNICKGSEQLLVCSNSSGSINPN